MTAPSGGAGHAENIVEKIYPHGILIGIDADADAHEAARDRLRQFSSNVVLVHDNNANIRSILRTHNFPTIDGLLLDLGVSSFQLDEGSKGFSYRSDDMLDMRMDRRQTMNAGTIINTYPEERLAEIFWNYGEERNSRKIARAIVERRIVKAIETSGELADIISEKVPGRFHTKSLARIFQALRIEVNGELTSLPRILNDVLELIASGGRIVVISYHSLEDRIVKHFIRKESQTILPSGNKLVPDTLITPNLRELTKKPIVPDEDELRSNPRSRSAKLRVAERV